MRKFFSPLNTLFVTIDKMYNDTIEFTNGLKLYKDTGYHPEEAATLIAKVVSVPRDLMKRPDYDGMSIDVNPGDEILMRYDVVFSYIEQPDRSTPVHTNLMLYNGQEYWKVDIQQVFAVIQDGKYKMLNGYVLCDPPAAEPEPTIASPSLYSIIREEDAARVVRKHNTLVVRHIGPSLKDQLSLDVQEGDTIDIKENVAQEYTINKERFFIIKQSHILSKATI